MKNEKTNQLPQVEDKYLLENVMEIIVEEKLDELYKKLPPSLVENMPGRNMSKHIRFENGYSLSVQANKLMKCYPERNFKDETDLMNFHSFEVLVYNTQIIEPFKDEWLKYFSFDFSNTGEPDKALFFYVPKKLIEATIAEVDKLYKLIPRGTNTEQPLC